MGQRNEQSSKHSLPLTEKLFPIVGPGCSSGLTFHGFHLSQLHKGGGKGERSPGTGKRTQTGGTVAPCPTADLFGTDTWMVMKKAIKTGNGMHKT